MTVKELKKSLDNYSDDAELIVCGGIDEYGEWAHLEVGHYENIPFHNFKGETEYAKEFISEAVLMEWGY